jgi:hypothetical protein
MVVFAMIFVLLAFFFKDKQEQEGNFLSLDRITKSNDPEGNA